MGKSGRRLQIVCVGCVAGPLRLRTLVLRLRLPGTVVGQLQRAQFELRVPFQIGCGLPAVRIGRRHLVCVQFGVGFGFLEAFGGEIGDGCVE